MDTMAGVRCSLNDESSALHVDTCKHGLMTIADLSYPGFAKLSHTEQWQALFDAKDSSSDGCIHPLEGTILLPELGGFTKLTRNIDTMHGILNQHVHGSLKLRLEHQSKRGRGNFTSTALLGNGFGRLLRAVNVWQLWFAEGAQVVEYPK